MDYKELYPALIEALQPFVNEVVMDESKPLANTNVNNFEEIPEVAKVFLQHGWRLASITGLDMGLENPNIEILYHFVTKEKLFNARVRISKVDSWVPSLDKVVPYAEPFERELSEMFRIEVRGINNPDLLYLPDSWDRNLAPLRKDFDPNDIQEVKLRSKS
jgi:NADH:ubiquinone oxidoreductase subunit C